MMVFVSLLVFSIFFPFFGGHSWQEPDIPRNRGNVPMFIFGVMMAWHALEFVNRVVEFIESLGVGSFDLFTAGTKNHMDDGHLPVFSIGLGG